MQNFLCWSHNKSKTIHIKSKLIVKLLFYVVSNINIGLRDAQLIVQICDFYKGSVRRPVLAKQEYVPVDCTMVILLC